MYKYIVQLYSFIQSFKFEEGVATYFINFFQEMHENNELKTRPALKLHRLKLITMKIKLVALQPMHCILPYSTHNVQLPQQNNQNAKVSDTYLCNAYISGVSTYTVVYKNLSKSTAFAKISTPNT